MRWHNPLGRLAQGIAAVVLFAISSVAAGCSLPAVALRPLASRSNGAAGSSSTPVTLERANLQQASLALQPFATGLSEPTQLTYAPDESGRIYITEQTGLILVAGASGRTLAQPFLDIRSLVLSGGERGLLSVAFHPHYKENGLFFVTYTNVDGNTVLARYRVSGDRLRADPASAAVLFVVPQLGGEHKSGQLFFGPDGYLYMSVGDGALGGGAVYGQRTNTLLGKILRLDVDHTSPGKNYTIPPDNPFVGDPNARGEIWAYGLRNPWRFSFDRATGDIFLGDVGESSNEEVDVLRAGSHGGTNFGWSMYEGYQCKQVHCSPAGLVMPIFTYAHVGGLCAVMGGYVYRGSRYPSLDGLYFFADYCTGRVYGLVAADAKPGQPSKTRLLVDLHSSVSAFGEDEAGELYVVGYRTGTIYHVTAMAAP